MSPRETLQTEFEFVLPKGFVDREGCRRYAANARRALEQRVAKGRAGATQ